MIKAILDLIRDIFNSQPVDIRQPTVLVPPAQSFQERFTNTNAAAITDADVAAVAEDLGVSVKHIEAIRKVESGPAGSFDAKGRRTILPEPHIFSRQTNRVYDASHPRLSYRRWGTRKYPRGSDDRWEMLEDMADLNEEAALSSVSWGLFQVMGFHWQALGHDSAEAFVLTMVESERGHLDAVADFIKANGLARKLRACKANNASSCVPFVKAYNGSGYARNNYHNKFARALR